MWVTKFTLLELIGYYVVSHQSVFVICVCVCVCACVRACVRVCVCVCVCDVNFV